MMEPATTSALITGAASLIGTGASAVSQAKLNKKNRRWQEKMYDKQRADRLSDWDLQNAYNSPAAQMKRLQEAGLNPNLVYGKGADNTAAPVSEANIGTPQTRALDFSGLGRGASDSLQAYNNFRLGTAQVDNLETRNTVNVQDAAMKSAQTSGIMVKTAKDQFELGMAKDLQQTSMDLQRESLRKLLADTRYTIDNNERAAATTASSLREAAERILLLREQTASTAQQRDHIRAQIQNLGANTEFKMLENKLMRDGIRPNDPFWWSALGRVTGEKPLEGGKRMVQDFFTLNPKSILGRAQAKLKSYMYRGATGSY